MKRKSIFLIGLVMISCTAIPVKFSEQEYHKEVFEDVTGTQAELFLKANAWMVETFNNAESVIQHSDKEAGAIIGKYLMYGSVSTGSGLYATTNDSRVYAIIDIRVKDNKARIEIKPQGEWQYDESGMTPYGYSKQDAINEMKTLAGSFHKALLKKESEF